MWPDGAVYQGQWKKNLQEGQGKFKDQEENIYDGGFKEGIAKGFGIYVHKSGMRYQGMWKDNLQHGKGQEIWPDGSIFNGIFRKGKKEGPGLF